MPGAMGGGGGGGTLEKVVTKAAETTTAAAETASDIGTTVVETASDVGTAVADTTTAALADTSAAITGAISGAGVTAADAAEGITEIHKQMPKADVYIPSEGYDKFGKKIVETVGATTDATHAALDAATSATMTNLATGADATKEALGAVADATHVNLETGANATKEALAAIADATKTNLAYGAGYIEDFRDKVIDTFINNPLEELMGVFDDKLATAAGDTGDTGETEEEKAIRIASGQDTFAKGNIGKKKKNNPFLAINKGKKFARGSTKFKKRPSATSTLRI